MILLKRYRRRDHMSFSGCPSTWAYHLEEHAEQVSRSSSQRWVESCNGSVLWPTSLSWSRSMSWSEWKQASLSEGGER